MGIVTYDSRKVIVWCIVEVTTGLIRACLPLLKLPLSLIGLKFLFSSNHSQPYSVKLPSLRSEPLPFDHTSGPRAQERRARPVACLQRWAE
jgi:hypothetical protein